ncbi:MAG: ATP phosphoribosyltransferase regulatory subunit [Lachnospiraceae bacterium]|nr:ATP phosphoribosyltransferase regulatory subunit [Lachnospiraceae bacterium]
MNSEIHLHTPEGVRDLYGEQYEKKKKVEDAVSCVLLNEGYKAVATPTLEYSDVFSSDIGTTPSKELYRFYDGDGNTLVLRPDFTPSIARCAAKYFMDEKDPLRLCYSGNAFSNTSSLQGKLKEVTQTGAELINDSSVKADGEMIALCINALKAAGIENIKITVGNADYYRGICNEAGLSKAVEHKLRDLIAQKNIYAAENYLDEQGVKDKDKLLGVTEFFGNSVVLKNALSGASNERSKKALERLLGLDEELNKLGLDHYITYDLSMLSKYDYYTGVIFRAYTYGIGEPIAKGGRYDNLLSFFGKDAPAIGFCVVIDDLLSALDYQETDTNDKDKRYLTFALGKGRLAGKIMEMLEKNGITCEEMKDKDTRKLIFVNEEHKLKFFLAKGPDVPTYVEYGAADIGVVGKDTILEENRDVFEVLDLGFGKCRMCVCGPHEAGELLKHRERIRVATKYPVIAKDYFYNVKHQTVDIIKLNGSVELGPIVELSDVIVDIVETGSTLRENGLEVLEEIMPLSARMIVNPVSMQMESERIKKIISDLRSLTE